MTRLLGVLRDIGRDVRAGRFDYIDEPKLPYADCNALFSEDTAKLRTDPNNSFVPALPPQTLRE